MANLRLYLIIGLAIAGLLVNFMGNVMSMFVDLALSVVMIALIWWPQIKRGKTEKK